MSEMRKDLRPNKVFIDWSQNDEHKTTVSVYSLRPARAARRVSSTPLTWERGRGACSRTRATPPTSSSPPTRCSTALAEHGDLFAPVLDLQQELPRLS